MVHSYYTSQLDRLRCAPYRRHSNIRAIFVQRTKKISKIKRKSKGDTASLEDRSIPTAVLASSSSELILTPCSLCDVPLDPVLPTVGDFLIDLPKTEIPCASRREISATSRITKSCNYCTRQTVADPTPSAPAITGRTPRRNTGTQRCD